MLKIITKKQAQHLGSAASVAGGWVAVSPVVRDAVAHVYGFTINRGDDFLAALPVDWHEPGRPVSAAELDAIIACVSLDARDDEPGAAVWLERLQAARAVLAA